MRIHHLPLLAAMLAALPCTAQGPGLRLRDSSRVRAGLSAYDTTRQRLVEIGEQGETREFDGATFFLRSSGGGPRMLGRMVHRSGTGRTTSYGLAFEESTLTYEPQTWQYDGNTWTQLQPALQPEQSGNFAMAYDTARDRIVLFGGASLLGNLTGDTYEWDGTNWSIAATTGPAPRTQPSMAYDEGRGVAVMFGGQVSGAGLQDEHWEWDGANWVLRTLATKPSARTKAAMGHDPTRAVTVLFGGSSLTPGGGSELWEFDGGTWQLIPSGSGPSELFNSTFAFDTAGARMLLTGTSLTTRSREIWSWDGATWQLLAETPATPQQSVYARSTVDPANGGAILFGSLFSNATWLYANGTWSVAGPAGPAARIEPVLWSDGTDAWMYGGVGAFGTIPLTDTWRWNGTAWQLQPTATLPGPRSDASAAYDSARNEAVLFGGRSVGVPPDTWTFDGNDWQQRTPTTLPPERRGAGMAYDPVRDRVVLFGGTSSFSQPRNDTWEWDGSVGNWTQIFTPQAPPAYSAASLEFDPASNRILMTHSRNTNSLVSATLEAWSYDGVNWTQIPLDARGVAGVDHELIREPVSGKLLVIDSTAVLELVAQTGTSAAIGTGCGSPAPRLAARDLPTIDNPRFGIDLQTDQPNAPVIFGGADSQAPQQVLGCTLYLGASLATALEFTNSAGFVSRDVPIPNQPTLLGTNWFFQAISLQAAAPLGIAFSAGLEIELGQP